MLKIYKHKGVSLIELMVAVGLGLTLILSMLAFYSISLQNTADFQSANHEQQQIRRMMNLLKTNIENTGGFECPSEPIFNIDNDKYPKNSISLGQNFDRKQIIFTHPITEEYRYTALGIMELNGANQFKAYSPTLVATGCGQDKSNIYIGTTILEIIPTTNITTSLNEPNAEEADDDITAFVSLSSIQSRRNNQGNLDTEVIEKYYPTMDDATVMLLSNNDNNTGLPFGKSEVTISLGFSPKTPEGANAIKFSHVPAARWTTLDNGGWINPFTTANFAQLTDTTLSDDKAQIVNRLIHNDSDADGQAMKTYPLSSQAMDQIRAIKFQFTLNAGTDKAMTLTRVVRFKNTHLMKLETGNN